MKKLALFGRGGVSLLCLLWLEELDCRPPRQQTEKEVGQKRVSLGLGFHSFYVQYTAIVSMLSYVYTNTREYMVT